MMMMEIDFGGVVVRLMWGHGVDGRERCLHLDVVADP